MRTSLSLVLLALLVAGCTADGATAVADAAVAQVQTGLVEAAAYTPVATLDGSLDPVASVQLGFDVPGRIESLHVHRGDVVQKGAALATLDSSMARAQLAQAEAAVVGAEAQLAAGEGGWAKAQQLHTAGALSQQQYADAEAAILAGRAGVVQAKAALQLARTHVANHTLRAPIAGTISAGPDNAGMMIGGGTPLFLLEDLSALQLKGSVGEADAWVTAGMAATVLPGTPGSTASAEAVVARVLPALDPVTRRLPVELRIEAAPEGFRAHAYAKATIRASEPLTVASVPTAAVVARPDFSVIAKRGDTYIKVPVAVLEEAGDRTLVRADLSPGDTVVLYPASGLGSGG